MISSEYQHADIVSKHPMYLGYLDGRLDYGASGVCTRRTRRYGYV